MSEARATLWKIGARTLATTCFVFCVISYFISCAIVPAFADTLLTKRQAQAKAVAILKGDPYGKTTADVSKHIRKAELLRAGKSICGPVAKPLWSFHVVVPAAENPAGPATIAGTLVLDAASGQLECAGLPFLD
ncbi:MAG: hypothetical protein BGP04_23730 [Rhizobiales bacterium 62-17]|nr:hypothetical protein [Hyphomicrobiales bacterium]OJY00558.1 MAG: hypothetical protein BGP04_23730 [Rhizobiales bacterium 62-17]